MSTRGPEDAELVDRFARARELHEAGRTREAEAEYRAVLTGRTDRGEQVHPDALAAGDDLAMLVAADGRVDEAAGIGAATTESYARHHGLDHPETLRSRTNLALILFTKGEFAAAAAMHASVLEARERALGAEAPLARESRSHLAATLARMGRAEDAEAHLRRNVALASGRHRTLAARTELADLLFQQDRLADALAEFTATHTEALAELDPADPVTVAAGHGRAAVLFGMGRFPEAEKGFREALAGYRSHEDPNRRLAQVSLAHLRAATGDADAAVIEVRGLLADSRTRWGEESPVTRCTSMVLGDVLLMADQPTAAVTTFTELVEVSTRTAGPMDSMTLCTRHMLGSALVRVGRTDEAEHELRLSSAREDRPPWHSCALAWRQGLARVALDRGDLDHAAEELAAVAAGMAHLYGEEHPNTLEARFDVADVLSRQGEQQAATEAHRAVLAARTRVLGADHPDTRRSAAALR